MREPMTEPFEPYEPYPDDSYDWDVDQEPRRERPMNILWGRVAILAGAVLLAFILGRASQSTGVPESQLTSARERIAALNQENDDLKAELAAQPEPEPPVTTEEEPAAATEEPEAESDEIVGETYTVKSGDTLQSIAESFYNDALLDDFLAEVNNISDPTTIHVGQELIIPDDPPSDD